MKKLLLTLAAGVVVASIASSAVAGPNLQANIAVDLRAKIMGLSCTNAMPVYTDCGMITQSKTWVANDHVIVVVYNYTEMQGVEFGLTWATPQDCTSYAPGYYLYPSWARCGTAPDIWSESTCAGQGIGRISIAAAWLNCNNPFATVVCFATTGTAAGATGPSTLHLGPSDTGVEQIASCHQELDNLHTLHDGYFNQAPPVPPGDNGLPPCTLGPTANENATWSGVKALYR
jgi:hypothetical protein